MIFLLLYRTHWPREADLYIDTGRSSEAPPVSRVLRRRRKKRKIEEAAKDLSGAGALAIGELELQGIKDSLEEISKRKIERLIKKKKEEEDLLLQIIMDLER